MRMLSVLIIGLFILQNSNAQNKAHGDSLDVLNYKINLNIIDFTNQQISGNTELTIASKISNLNVISLDLLKLVVDSVYINSSKTDAFIYNDTLLNIQTSIFNLGDTFKTTIYYHGHPVIDPSAWGGFYFTTSSAYNLGVGFEDNPHNYGRVWFPCIDDFTDRAFYDFYITTSNDQKAVCGGTLMSVIDNGNGTSTHHWTLHNSIPTYLASVAVSDYVAVGDIFHGINGNIPTYIYALPTDTTNARNSFVNLNSILGIFENRFGPYRWERVGYVSVPFNSGAMEHATNIAYPTYCLTGNLAYEDLYAHELSHHWFGDLITCFSAADMWINEGWASFCEYVYKEDLYGTNAAKNYIRPIHNKLVRYQHIEDNGYRAIYGIPHEYTYSRTVYDKGADVVHSLRNYLGDSLFFCAVKAMNNTFAFKDISTIQMRDFLSANTGVDLTDFFNFWVYSPGFTHFSVDSVKTTPNGNTFNATVYIRQKLKGVTQLANSNKVEITFFDSNWNRFTSKVSFSGQFGSSVCSVPFQPIAAFLDLEEKMADATVDNYKIIKTAGTYVYDQTYFSAVVSGVTDSVFLRVTHNWVQPDPLKTPVAGLVLSPNRYWKIEGILSPGFAAKGRFSYNGGISLQQDHDLITNTIDSLKILYRASPAEDWCSVHFIRQGNANIGTLVVDTLKLGEYTLALYDWNVNSEKLNSQVNSEKLVVYPNPSDTDFTIDFTAKSDVTIKIFNEQGKLVFEKKCTQSLSRIYWHPGKLAKGVYLVKLFEEDKVIGTSKVTYK